LRVFAAILLASLPLHAIAAYAADAPLTVGWVERVRIHPGEIVLDAKLDTGADTSSLGAERIGTFRRDGHRWVAFEIAVGTAAPVRIERPLVRTVRIKDRGVRTRERPVVKLGICIGTFYREAEVNLVDRSHFDYPMLVGRSFLGQGLAVDAARRFTIEPSCTGAREP
jgi:hypothetical protein